jgi:hypothetical protein
MAIRPRCCRENNVRIIAPHEFVSKVQVLCARDKTAQTHEIIGSRHQRDGMPTAKNSRAANGHKFT